MPRSRDGVRTRQKHKKILAQTKGFRGSRNRLFKRANEAVVRAGEHAFAGRKKRKRDARVLWIQKINGALAPFEIQYSRFIDGLKKANIELDRKMLSNMAQSDPKAFQTIVSKAKEFFA